MRIFVAVTKIRLSSRGIGNINFVGTCIRIVVHEAIFYRKY